MLRKSLRERELSWWTWPGSNRRPPACKAGALPAELHAHSFNLFILIHFRSQRIWSLDSSVSNSNSFIWQSAKTPFHLEQDLHRLSKESRT
jgi:hypothetical protein